MLGEYYTQNINSKYKVRTDESFFIVCLSNYFLIRKTIQDCVLLIGIVVLTLILKKTAITLIVLLLIFLVLINSLIYSLNKLRNSNVFKFNRVTKLVTTEKETIPLLNVSRLKVLSEFDNNDIAFYAVLLETKSGTVIQILDSYQRNEINLIINSLISYEDFNIPVFYETSNI